MSLIDSVVNSESSDRRGKAKRAPLIVPSYVSLGPHRDICIAYLLAVSLGSIHLPALRSRILCRVNWIINTEEYAAYTGINQMKDVQYSKGSGQQNVFSSC